MIKQQLLGFFEAKTEEFKFFVERFLGFFEMQWVSRDDDDFEIFMNFQQIKKTLNVGFNLIGLD